MSTPEGQRLATGSTADSESAPADACMLSHKAADNYSGLHSSNTNMDQAGPHPTAPESGENTVASGAHVDLLAARHPQQVVHDKPEAAAPALPDRGLRLAELHAHIIAVISSVSLAAELDLLLHLIALPPGISCQSSADALHQQQPTFSTGAVAVLYAAQVIDQMSSKHTPGQYERIAGISQLYGAGAFTQDGQRQRSQEEQRKLSNINDCRDAWAELMRTAAQQQAGQLKSGVSTRSQPSSQGFPGSSAALLLYMQQHVHKPLRRLRHDNYSTFADIFTTALLQAAATGETLLDSGNSKTARTLQKQADKDASKIFRLNQRMQGQAVGHRPSHQGRYSTNSGGVRSGGSSPFQSPGMPSHQGTAAQPHLGFHQQMGKPFAPQATLSETDLVDIALAVQFPPAQQPFLMFLQAADSHRLNTSLARQDCAPCMNARLQRMHQSSLTEAAASDRAKSERLVSQCCLASFLSFFTFSVHAGSPPSDASACHAHFQPGTDLSAALYAAALAKSLEWVVPWVVHYVRFASQDSDAEQSCCIQQLLQQLSSIKSCKALLPKSAQFGAVASCLRCVLDDHLEQSAEIERSVSEADAAWLSALQDWESTAQLQGPVLDARYLHLCCPLLEQARQAIQASTSAEHGHWGVKKAKLKGMRKITPSQPLGATPKLKARLPSNVAAAAAAGQDASSTNDTSVKTRLQQAFLEQYSPADAKTMEMCFEAAKTYIESQSVHALAALAHPAWTKAVIGTAAAMVVETATPMCAKQLILEVPTAVRKQIQWQLDNTNSTVMKAAKANSKA
ncbi:hypothetical protein ABBQ32_011767 [Trebouxia sp. C0010 RCD-2024]